MDVIFLDVSDVLNIHANQIEHYGGSSEIRDMGLLESAVFMPRTSFAGEYVHHDLFEMAAAYLYHLAMNHPFVDGNKRTALVCAICFLALNDIEVKPEDEAFTDFVFSVAQGQKDKVEIAAFLKQHSIRKT